MDAAPSASAGPAVEILGWPAEGARRDELAARRVPRLLVLEAGTLPPEGLDDLEDWIWLPADERDVFSRVRHLDARRQRASLDRETIRVGDDDVAWIAGHRLALPPAEAAILGLLAAPPEHLCTREDLQRAVWGDTPHQRRSLDSRVLVLRRRLAPHRLAVLAVRGRGFVLTRTPPSTGPDR